MKFKQARIIIFPLLFGTTAEQAAQVMKNTLKATGQKQSLTPYTLLRIQEPTIQYNKA